MTQLLRFPAIMSSIPILPPTNSSKILSSRVEIWMHHLTNLFPKISEELTGKQELVPLVLRLPQTRISLQISPMQLEVLFHSNEFSSWKNPTLSLAPQRQPLHRNRYLTLRSKPPIWWTKLRSMTRKTTIRTACDTEAQPWGTQRKIQTDSLLILKLRSDGSNHKQ